MTPAWPIASILPKAGTAEMKIAASMTAAQRREKGVSVRAKARANSTTPAARM